MEKFAENARKLLIVETIVALYESARRELDTRDHHLQLNGEG